MCASNAAEEIPPNITQEGKGCFSSDGTVSNVRMLIPIQKHVHRSLQTCVVFYFPEKSEPYYYFSSKSILIGLVGR